MQPVVKKSPALAVGGLILSGVLMVTGSLLTWYELEYSGLSLTVKGTDISMGNGVLRIGVLVTLIAVILLNRASKTGGRGWSIAAFILAVVVLPPSTFAAFEPEAIASVAASEKVSKEFRVSPSVVEAALERVSQLPEPVSATAFPAMVSLRRGRGAAPLHDRSPFPPRGGGRESNPPASFRPPTDFEGMSGLVAASKAVTSGFVFGRRPRTCKDL